MKVASGSSNGYSEVSQTPYNIGNDEPYPLSSLQSALVIGS